MSNQPNHIYLVMDAGSPVAAFTIKHELKAYLTRRLEALTKPLVYTFGGEQGYGPAIMTLTRALADA